ncbi:MAG: XRE family transcriptional regulator, partial [Acetobacter syzygii]
PFGTPPPPAFPPPPFPNTTTQAMTEEQDLLARKETLDLVRAYYQIPDKTLRQKVLDLVQSMAKPSFTD